MKKIFVVLATRNESDIIESYCRYNLTFCDGMIIYERQSSDNTNEIIRKLIAEGLPIYLYDDPNVVLGPFKEGNVVDAMAYRAINEYGADLIIPLDTDEFLYHIDGINPREILETLHEDVEYQALWRTYVYEKEPDIKLGFMPNNFISYRNPVMEDPIKYERHKKVIASSYLIKKYHTTFVIGWHFLEYPEEYHNSIKIDILEKMVFAHFPIRSKTQVMRKVIPNWIYKWKTSNRDPREILDALQLGVLFNEIRDNGDVALDKIKQYSINYAMMLDADKFGNISVYKSEELEKIKFALGEALTITGKMQTSFCSDKLKLYYTNYNENSKIFMRAILTEIDKVVTFLSAESDEKSKLINEIQRKYLPTSMSNIYLDTGNGFNAEEILAVPLFRHENYFEAAVTLPPNIKNIRFDPIDGFACIIDNIQITTDVGIIEYSQINGITADGINIFDNLDPHIIINFKGRNISNLKITGNMRHFIMDDISFLSKIKQVLEKYFAEVEVLTTERDGLVIERNNLTAERDGLVIERNNLTAERDGIISSRSWRITKPLRLFTKILRYIFHKNKRI